MIVIITKKNINILDEDILIINKEIEMIDDYHFLLENKIYQFDYLIFDDLSLIKGLEKTEMLIDDNFPVTNYYGETSLDQFLYGDIISCLNYLKNGD